MTAEFERIHATSIAVDGKAALILGPSGAGKSDLAFRCLTSALVVKGRTLAAQLVADDQVELWRDGQILRVRAPTSIRGLLEVRGLGIVAFPPVASAEVRLVVALGAADRVDRLPDPGESLTYLGLSVPLLRLAPFEASSPAKLAWALVARGHGNADGD